jgi:hypothetical protein
MGTQRPHTELSQLANVAEDSVALQMNFVAPDVSQTAVLQIAQEAEDMMFVIESLDTGKAGTPLNVVAEP